MHELATEGQLHSHGLKSGLLFVSSDDNRSWYQI